MFDHSPVSNPSINPLKRRFCVQQREWNLNVPARIIENRLSTFYDSNLHGDTGWETTHLLGFFRSTADFRETSLGTTLRYKCYLTVRGFRFSLALWLLVIPIGIIAFFPHIYELIVPIPPRIILLLFLAMLVVQTYFHRGPVPRFATNGLENQYTTFSMFYTFYSFSLVLYFGLVIGRAFVWPVVLPPIVLSLIFFITKYTTGTLPNSDEGLKGQHLGATEPLFRPTYPHLNVGMMGVLPAVLTYLSWVAGAFLLFALGLTDNPHPLLFYGSTIVFSIGFTLLYCYWCLSLIRWLRSRRIEPYRTLGRRLLILGVLIFVNIISVVLMSSFLTILILPIFRTVLIETQFETLDFFLILFLVFGLFSVAVVGAFIQSWSKRRAGFAKLFLQWIAKCGNYTVLICIFGLLLLPFGNVILSLVAGDTITVEQGMFAEGTRLLGIPSTPLPYILSETLILVLMVLPLVILAFSFAVHINGKLQDFIAIREVTGYLDPTDRPVPNSVRIPVVNIDIFAVVQGSLVGSPKILVGNQLVEEIESEAGLNALLAHEAYHIQNYDHKINILANLSAFLIGGQNVLLSFYDIAESERRADRYARECVSADALRSALRTCKRLQVEQVSNGMAASPAFVGSLSGTVSRTLFDGESIFSIRSSLSTVWKQFRLLLISPYALLFGAVLYQQSHLDYGDRMVLINLPKAITDYLHAEAETQTLWLPQKQTVTIPVPRASVYNHFQENGATQEQIDAVIDELVDDGQIVEVGDGCLLRNAENYGSPFPAGCD